VTHVFGFLLSRGYSLVCYGEIQIILLIYLDELLGLITARDARVRFESETVNQSIRDSQALIERRERQLNCKLCEEIGQYGKL